MARTISFPEGFVWGTATAAYQVEGAVAEDGRGESIWDRFSHTPNTTANGDTGDVACDHYRRWRDDIALMADLGIQAYRFSIAWSRIFPTGTGELNNAGLDFYSRLVDELLDAGITPFPTLYHWDLPQALEDAGGWPARDTAAAFAEYAATMALHLGDRVEHWWTINEPWVAATLGYNQGVHAPGRREPAAALAASHHLLLAHGLATQAIHDTSGTASVGIVVNGDAMVPRSPHPADFQAAEAAHAWMTRWYLDPIFLGSYPDSVVADLGWDSAPVQAGDLDIISTPIDHLGINYYTRRVVADPTVDDADRPEPLVRSNLPRTAMGWEIYPEGLLQLLSRYEATYDLPPVYITENGISLEGDTAGTVDDTERRDFLGAHLAVTADAVAQGIPVSGYFVWSLLDNYEWHHGYGQRFGIVHVDYETQERTVKASGQWYRDVIAGNGFTVLDD